MVFTLMFANYIFEMPVPVARWLQEDVVTLRFSPLLFGPDPENRGRPEAIDLSGSVVVRDATVPFQFTYRSAQHTHTSREENIARRAYRIWQESGCKHGHDLDDWLLAEQEMLLEHRSR